MSHDNKESEERIQQPVVCQLTDEADHCVVTLSFDPNDLPSVHGLLHRVHRGTSSSETNSASVTSPTQCDDDTNALRLLQALNDQNDTEIDECLSLKDVHHWINNEIKLNKLRNPVTSFDPEKHTTCIKYAVRHCDAVTVRRLLEAGADVRAVYSCGCRLLTKACRSDVDSNAKVTLLLQRDASPINELTCTGVTPLKAAVMYGKADVVKTRIDYGADVEARTRTTEFTPLHTAATAGQCNCIHTLLDKFGADVNATDKTGGTALHHACVRGHVSCIHELMARGADVQARTDRIGLTPLHVAAQKNQLDCIKTLIEVYSASINATDSIERWTALHDAASEGHIEAVKALLSYPQCDITIKASSWLVGTAHDVAKRKGHHSIVKLLEERYSGTGTILPL